MRRVLYLIALLVVACTKSPYPGIDSPNNIGGTAKDQNIIAYIDKRLEGEYYWLDEVVEKRSQFNRNLKWDSYLDNTLGRLKTNGDDGYVNSKGQRAFYSYIRDVSSTTRADINGFGIGLHYTIATIDAEKGRYGFVVEKAFPNSPAAEAGVVRGDVITMIGGSYITSSNYYHYFMSIENNSTAQLELTLRRQTDGNSYDMTLTKGKYAKTPVLHHGVIEVDGKKIGYLVYTSFDQEYNQDMLDAIMELKAAGVEEFILDLRCNSGGAVTSAVRLCSALMPQRYEGQTLCSLVRNPNNTISNQITDYKLEKTGEILSLESLTVICSDYTASASELVVMGLRGLDVPVTLVGSQTEGKNCGMDVTRKMIDGTTVEFAPITFMCFNAKGFGDWGEGIVPDIDLTKENNEAGVSDKNYPLPRADWGDYNHDIALAVALAKITGRSVSDTTRSTTLVDLPVAAYIDYEIEGIRNYIEE